MRLGVAYAHSDIIGIFNNVKYPYNINILTQREALKVLDAADEVARVAGSLVSERNRLAETLLRLSVVRRYTPLMPTSCLWPPPMPMACTHGCATKA